MMAGSELAGMKIAPIFHLIFHLIFRPISLGSKAVGRD
jgi:hypothetical protein